MEARRNLADEYPRYTSDTWDTSDLGLRDEPLTESFTTKGGETMKAEIAALQSKLGWSRSQVIRELIFSGIPGLKRKAAGVHAILDGEEPEEG